MKLILMIICMIAVCAMFNGISGQQQSSTRARLIGPERPPHLHTRQQQQHRQELVDRPERPQRPQRPVSSYEVEEDNTGRDQVAPSGHRHHVDESERELSEDDVQSVVCTEGDIPERQIKDFDKCTRHIPAYRELNILKRCREKLMDDLTLNEQRLALCFNKTAEDQFKTCAQEISNREGQNLPDMSDHDGHLFMRCMREVAGRPRPVVAAAAAASSPSVVPASAPSARHPTWLTPDRPGAIAREHESFLTPSEEHGSSSGYLPPGGDRLAGSVNEQDDPPLYEDQPPSKPRATQSKQFSARIESSRGKRAQRISGIITAAVYEDDHK